MRFRFLATLFAGCTLSAALRAAVLPPTDPWPANFGVNINNLSPGTVDWAWIAKVAHWVRTGDAWTFVERTPGKYNWKKADGFINGARSHGLSCVVGLAYGNKAYGTADYLAPPTTTRGSRQLAGFVKWCIAVVGRYGTKGVAYEIWNEPEAPIFWDRHTGVKGGAKAADYGRMDVAVYNAIKKAHPGAVVIGGGGVGGEAVDAVRWSRSVAGIGLAKGDLWSIHPYRHDRPEMVRDVEVAGLKSYPGLPPLCQTEWGWPAEWGVNNEAMNGDERRSAALAVRIALQGAEQHWPINIYFNWQDGYVQPDNLHWGLLRKNGQAKPSYVALYTLNKAIGGFRYAGKAPAPAGCTALLFHKGAKSVIVAWNDTTNQLTGAAQMTVPAGAKALAMDGSAIPITAKTVSLGYAPVLIRYTD